MPPLAWEVPSVDERAVGALAAEMRIRPLTAKILVARGILGGDQAARFLTPRLANLRPPHGMADLDRALARIERALGAGETIGIFGDYDVDGVTTAAVLATALRAFGGRVVPRAASRHAGYGLGPEDVRRFAADGCSVIVTGDCGTSDIEALELGRGLGIDVLVIDHHQVPAGETPAYALINPHRPDDTFPFKGLASCGVAFYLAASLRSRLRDAAPSFDPRDLLDLVALGTIANLVPLTDENRILVSAGLRTLAGRRRPGVAALATQAEIGVEDGRVPSAHDVSFRLAPRLNAAGRLGEAQLALDLLLAPDEAVAGRLAAELEDRNRERQRIQEEVWAQAAAAAEERGDDVALVVGAEGWHQGVLGIIAARLCDRYGRPAVVVGFRDGEGRGSARTAGGVNLFEALSRCGEHLTKYGGHAAAAGLSMTAERLSAFRRAFVAEAARQLAGTPGAVRRVDAVVELADLDVGAAEELGRLAPFGAANAEPLFALTGVTTQTTRCVGQGHLQLVLADRGWVSEAIAFGMADRDPGSGARLNLLATAELDVFRGMRRARLKVKELVRSPPPSDGHA